MFGSKAITDIFREIYSFFHIAKKNLAQRKEILQTLCMPLCKCALPFLEKYSESRRKYNCEMCEFFPSLSK